MEDDMGYSKSKMLARGAAVLMIAATLPGCLPLTTPTLISLAVDGISFMATGKSVADHAISELAQQDCSVGRAVFTGTDVCFAEDETPVIALGDVSDDTSIPIQPASGADPDDVDYPVMAF